MFATRTKANPDPVRRSVPILEKMCDLDPRRPYRIHHVIWQIADEHKFYGKTEKKTFTRAGGMCARSVPIVRVAPRPDP